MCVTQREARDDFLDESQKVSNADEHNAQASQFIGRKSRKSQYVT